MLEINTQPISKLDLCPDGSLYVHSLWRTIQGEGPYAGRPAVFVRLWACNLMCPLCDTEYTSAKLHMLVPQLCLMIEREAKDSDLVVFTGGEPFRQNLKPIVSLLNDRRRVVQIETNGTLPSTLGRLATASIVCSPKAGRIDATLLPQVAALKYVVEDGQIDPTDGLPLSVLGNKVRVARPPQWFNRTKIYVQPLDVADPEQNQKHIAAAVKSCMDFGYTLCLQVHKYANLP